MPTNGRRSATPSRRSSPSTACSRRWTTPIRPSSPICRRRRCRAKQRNRQALDDGGRVMASEYRLLTYRGERGRPCAGVLVGERVYPAADLLRGADDIDACSVLGLLQSWDQARALLRTAVKQVMPEQGLP